MLLKKLAFLILIIILPLAISAQNDTIVANNGNVIIGEVKGMSNGVLKMKTSYSDSDFAIEWLKIKDINTTTPFLTTVTGGALYSGRLKSKGDSTIEIITDSTSVASVPIASIVYLRKVKNDFLSRLSASISLGYNFTKSNNFSQFSLRSTLGYQTKTWTLYGNYNNIHSNRNDTDAIKRMDAAVSYRYFLRKDYFPLVEVNLLSNTEQNIDLRTVARVGMGKYIYRSNHMYWGVQAGTSYNNERFTDAATTSQSSLEGFIGSELNLYDMGDISLLTKIIAYPGITESGRLRFDGSLDLKYDLPLDFFIQFGVTVNYDNQSIGSGNQYDYIFQTSFGWEL